MFDLKIFSQGNKERYRQFAASTKINTYINYFLILRWLVKTRLPPRLTSPFRKKEFSETSRFANYLFELCTSSPCCSRCVSFRREHSLSVHQNAVHHFQTVIFLVFHSTILYFHSQTKHLTRIRDSYWLRAQFYILTLYSQHNTIVLAGRNVISCKILI